MFARAHRPTAPADMTLIRLLVRAPKIGKLLVETGNSSLRNIAQQKGRNARSRRQFGLTSVILLSNINYLNRGWEWRATTDDK